MSLQLLISTMHQTDYSLLDRMKVDSDAVVINQGDMDGRSEIIYKRYHVIWINTKERGLSRSRNLAIRNSTADICVLADDDEEFIKGYELIIKDTFDKHREYSVIRFQVSGIEKKFKKYPNKSIKIGYLFALKVSSVEIAFRRRDIVDHKIVFNERLGAGTEFMMGEENTVLFNCLENNLKIIFVPKIISNLHIEDSSWFNGYNKKYFIGRGASFAAMSQRLSLIFIIQYAIRKYRYFKVEMGIIDSITYMLHGRRRYLKNE
jgi:glycosyltransferase involved in cell wall biosynthesis